MILSFKNQFKVLCFILLFFNQCKKETYFGHHQFNVFKWNTTNIYNIIISGSLNYVNPNGKSELAKGFNLYSIYVKTNTLNDKTESFIQELIIHDNVVTIGEIHYLTIMELNENICILKYELSDSKTWIIKIFKEKENKTRIQEFVNEKLQEEYYLTAGII